MAGKSNIEWTGFTWNPIAGCTVLTPGCKRCYAMKMAARLEKMGQELYAGLTKPSNAGPVWTGVVRKAPEHVLLGPLRRKKPTTYFVNSMSDLFHEDVPDEWIDLIVAVMAMTPHHTYQVLTKRAERMRDYLTKLYKGKRHLINASHDMLKAALGRVVTDELIAAIRSGPFPNVWFGVSTERQKEADERIPLLLLTPAAIRFVSAEPLLGPIDLTGIKLEGIVDPFDALVGATWCRPASLGGQRFFSGAPNQRGAAHLDWVIVGGESGSLSEVRRFDLRWARSIVNQCKAADVACFVKQMGADPVDSDLVAEGDGPSVRFKDKKGGDPAEWPAELRVREMPRTAKAEAA